MAKPKRDSRGRFVLNPKSQAGKLRAWVESVKTEPSLPRPKVRKRKAAESSKALAAAKKALATATKAAASASAAVVKLTKKRKRQRTKIPAGFRKVTRTTPVSTLPANIAMLQSIAAAQQRRSLAGAAHDLEREGKCSVAYRVHANKDGTVDGEIRMFNLKRGYTVNEATTDLGLAIHGTPEEPSEWKLPEGHWFSAGALTDWGGTKEDWLALYEQAKTDGHTDAEARALANAGTSPQPRYKGLSLVMLYPQRIEQVPANIFRAQQGMLGEAHMTPEGKKLGRGRKSKPQAILARFYWNPWGVRPNRQGQPAKRKKAT